jgi:Fe-S cluster biogenesis protein NfuA
MVNLMDEDQIKASKSAKAEFGKKMAKVESLVARLETCRDEKVREDAQELVGTLLDFHGSAIERMLKIMEDTQASGAIEEMGRDHLVSSVLLLHGLHPASFEERIEGALESVRPMLHAHKGDIELLSANEELVRLRLKGTCHGCPSSTQTFRNLIEEAISDRVPEAGRIEVEGMMVEHARELETRSCGQ